MNIFALYTDNCFEEVKNHPLLVTSSTRNKSTFSGAVKIHAKIFKMNTIDKVSLYTNIYSSCDVHL